tara:strand:+ start:631 stop:1083 length:453 start_codon:yes stop_codon:yes gene_type:complete
MKKITKLNEVAFHLLNKVNKKKLKINTLLIKNWEKIFQENHNKVKIKKITLWGQDNLLNLEFSVDSGVSFELHTQMEIIKLKCEELVGQKVNKIHFFHDCIENLDEKYFCDKSDKELQLKDVNYQNFNDIKDEEVRNIFLNIRKKIDSDA